MAENLPLSKAEPWFKAGLRFKCTGCGQCCTGAPGFVWLEEAEVLAIAAHLGLTEEAFRQAYVRQVENRLSLIEKASADGFDCIFLKHNRCQIYEVRPQQCRTYPWWLHNLTNKAVWEAMAKECEGVNHPDAPLIPMETILKSLA